MYQKEDFIINVESFSDPEIFTNLLADNGWHQNKDQLMTHYFHTNYGHCVNVDFASLSQNDGKFMMSREGVLLHLRATIGTTRGDEIIPNILFLNNGTDVDNIGESIMPLDLATGSTHVSVSQCGNLMIFLFLKFYVKSIIKIHVIPDNYEQANCQIPSHKRSSMQ